MSTAHSSAMLSINLLCYFKMSLLKLRGYTDHKTTQYISQHSLPCKSIFLNTQYSSTGFLVKYIQTYGHFLFNVANPLNNEMALLHLLIKLKVCWHLCLYHTQSSYSKCMSFFSCCHLQIRSRILICGLDTHSPCLFVSPQSRMSCLPPLWEEKQLRNIEILSLFSETLRCVFGFLSPFK